MTSTTQSATPHPAGTPGPTGTLDRFFKLREHNTDVRTELLAGLTTFVVMSSPASPPSW